MKRSLSRELAALLPWLAAGLLWFGVVTPMRADQENRLAQQSRVRRDRLKAERALREGQGLRARIAAALGKACRASADPAALRQRTVAATAGLPLSPFTLSVSGGTGGGASVEAEGTRSAVVELLRRFGDPGRGGFLRTATLRDKGPRWTVTATTGILETFPGGIVPVPVNCPSAADPGPLAPSPAEKPKGQSEAGAARPLPTPTQPLDPVGASSPEPVPAPPLTLVAFLTSAGKPRVSVRAGDVIRVVSVGDQVEGWRCASIDRDEGAVFTSPTKGRLVLKAAPPAVPSR